MKHKSSENQLIIGVFILILGVLALVDNLNIFYMRNALHFWPVIFIVFGLLKLKQSPHGKPRIWPFIFIIAGSLMTLDNMGILHFQIHDWWPAIFIVIGIKMVVAPKNKYGKSGEFVRHENSSENVVDITAVLGGSESHITSQDFRAGDITAILGGVEVDFRQANIVEQAMLDVTSVMGGVVLKIPRDWIVVNQIGAVLGGLQDKTMPAVDARKRLLITGTVVMGGVEIKN